MKFFIVLVILLAGEENPRVMQYKYSDFLEIETCDLFLKTKKSQLKESVENQFPVETIHSSMMVCMTAQEINQINESKQDGKLQEPKHI